MTILQVNNLSKTHRRGAVPAVNNVSFQLGRGRLLALVGESGSGKTTLLRMLAGLETPDHGSIVLDGRTVSSPGSVTLPEHRDIGFVFQQHALFPHLTVEKNVAFGIAPLDKETRAEIVTNMLSVVGLSSFGKRFPHELSGGERQRVALARALAPNPKLLLLDEPFSSLDAGLRQAMRDETRAILRERETTAIFVTHDTADALSIADEIAVLRRGELQQIGTPPDVYRKPANTYVASFFGACNFLPAPDPVWSDATEWKSCCIGPPPNLETPHPGLWIRPEDLRILPEGESVEGALSGIVHKVGYQGGYLEVVLRCDAQDGAHFDLTVWQRAPFAVHSGEHRLVVPR